MVVNKYKPQQEDDEEILAEKFENNPSGWVSSSMSEKKEAFQAAKASRARKEARVSIQISKELFDRLKEQAKSEGLEYQTYISSKLYKLAFSTPVEKRLERLEEEVFTKI